MYLRLIVLCLLWPLFGSISPAQTTAARESPHPTFPAGVALPGKFVDITAKSQFAFQGQASHTPMKYLLETMGSGVALFDYDNDGLLDIFFANGAPLSNPTRGPFRRIRKRTELLKT